MNFLQILNIQKSSILFNVKCQQEKTAIPVKKQEKKINIAQTYL